MSIHDKPGSGRWDLKRAWRGQRRPRIAVAHRIVGETRDEAKAKTVPVQQPPYRYKLVRAGAAPNCWTTPSASRPAEPQALAWTPLLAMRRDGGMHSKHEEGGSG